MAPLWAELFKIESWRVPPERAPDELLLEICGTAAAPAPPWDDSLFALVVALPKLAVPWLRCLSKGRCWVSCGTVALTVVGLFFRFFPARFDGTGPSLFVVLSDDSFLTVVEVYVETFFLIFDKEFLLLLTGMTLGLLPTLKLKVCTSILGSAGRDVVAKVPRLLTT